VTTSPESALPFDITVEEFPVGPHRLRLWRPVEPQEVDDPEAERGLAGPVWAQTWTSGFVLADLVARQSLRGVRVLDVGCGLGLVGLAAARAGADVTVSDRSRYALALPPPTPRTTVWRCEPYVASGETRRRSSLTVRGT
jgi:SAM-dependent methyltransferase